MEISKDELLTESGISGFRPEILEKVWRLMNVLEGISAHPFLNQRLALKGGTALNLFVFDLPRLSVDIDLNYIGLPDKLNMEKERPRIEEGLESVFHREGLYVRRAPNKHAGGKWQLKYTSVMGGNGNLEVDLNFMFRIPLSDICRKKSHWIGNRQLQDIALLDECELGAGKLAALFARHASRDLFDARELLTRLMNDIEKLRLFSTVYGVMSGQDWRSISIEDLGFEQKEMQSQLMPVLSKHVLNSRDWDFWSASLLFECQQNLRNILPLQENEKEFVERVLDYGEIHASLLTDEPSLADKITLHPLLRWRAQLVKESKNTN